MYVCMYVLLTFNCAQYTHTLTNTSADELLKLSIYRLKSLFLSSTQSLLHGDLHTGSVMAKEGSTVVIDPEFAFYGMIYVCM